MNTTTTTPTTPAKQAHTSTELPQRMKFIGNLLVSADESVVIGTFRNVKGRPDYREEILRRINR